MAGRFPPSAGPGEVLIDRVEAREQVAEPTLSEPEDQGQPARRAERGPPADPVPDPEHLLGGDPDLLAGGHVRRDADQVARHPAVAESRLEPPACGLRVLDRLERRHRLRDDDEQGLLRIEVARRPREVGGIDVRDEPDGQLGHRERPQRLVGHRRAEVAAADPDVHDRADPPPGAPHPRARVDLLRERRHAVELLVHGLHDVLAVHDERARARHPQRDVERGAVLRDVHSLAAEHRPHLVLQAPLGCQLPEELHRVVREPVLRVVEPEALRLRRQALAAARVAGKEVAEMDVAHLPVVPLETPPGRRLSQRVSHARAPARPPRGRGRQTPGRPSRRSRCPRRGDRRPPRAPGRSCPR